MGIVLEIPYLRDLASYSDQEIRDMWSNTIRDCSREWVAEVIHDPTEPADAESQRIWVLGREMTKRDLFAAMTL